MDKNGKRQGQRWDAAAAYGICKCSNKSLGCLLGKAEEIINNNNNNNNRDEQSVVCLIKN